MVRPFFRYKIWRKPVINNRACYVIALTNFSRHWIFIYKNVRFTIPEKDIKSLLNRSKCNHLFTQQTNVHIQVVETLATTSSLIFVWNSTTWFILKSDWTSVIIKINSIRKTFLRKTVILTKTEGLISL